LSPRHRALLCKAALRLLLIRFGLAVLGYRRFHQFLAQHARSHAASTRQCFEQVEQIVWALSTAATVVLNKKSCLPLALTAQFWLGRCGVPTNLRIGAMRDESGRIQAHAWIEQQGQIILGGSPSIGQYKLMT